MELFVTFLIGFVIGYVVKGVRDGLQLRKDIEEAERDAEESKADKGPRDFLAYMLESDGIYYLYDKADDSFLAQGKTSEEIADHLYKRFPGSRVFISKENGNQVGFQK